MSGKSPSSPAIRPGALPVTAENLPRRAGKLRGVFVLVAACWFLPAAAHADTFLVNVPWDGADIEPGNRICETAPGTGICTLRAAIMEANRAPGSTVDLTRIPGGVALLGLRAVGSDDETTGDLNVRADMTIVGSGPGLTTIDANREFTSARALHVAAVTVSLTGVTIRNGGASYGGGLYLAGGTVFITDCVIAANQASASGAGIYQGAGTATTIERTTIDGNQAYGYGGGITAGGKSIRIANSAITSNEAGVNAVSNYGGGGIVAGAQLTTIENSTISGNRGYDAGGVMVLAATRVFNSTITYNRAAGGSKYSTGKGGGVWALAAFSSQNTILAGNSETYYNYLTGFPEPTGNDCRGTLQSGGNNLVGITGGCTIVGPILPVTNLALGPLQNNGGPTATHALLPGSDAIDAGAPGGCRDALGGLISADQRGAWRPFGAACDIGAFESTACTYSFTAASVLRVAATGSAGELSVAANDNRCAWTAASSAPWIVVTAGSTGNGTVGYTVLPNPGGARSGTMTVAGQSFTVTQAAHEGARGNFDGDRQTDLALYQASSGRWSFRNSTTGFVTGPEYVWGTGADVPVAADYDGDGSTDVAVFRPSTGHWFILKSSTAFTAWNTYQWGTAGDVPVPGDYDGDGKADIAIYRPPTGMWFILRSSTGFTGGLGYGWGASGDVPVASDYDGDGTTDVAVYRPSSGHWFVLRSNSRFTRWDVYQCGIAGDIPVPADYDGDVRADPAVYQPSSGVWHILQSSTAYTQTDYTWGISDDLPVAGDYDADGIADIAVYRPSTSHWFILKSSTSFTTWVTYQWGSADDIPILARW